MLYEDEAHFDQEPRKKSNARASPCFPSKEGKTQQQNRGFCCAPPPRFDKNRPTVRRRLQTEMAATPKHASCLLSLTSQKHDRHRGFRNLKTKPQEDAKLTPFSSAPAPGVHLPRSIEKQQNPTKKCAPHHATTTDERPCSCLLRRKYHIGNPALTATKNYLNRKRATHTTHAQECARLTAPRAQTTSGLPCGCVKTRKLVKLPQRIRRQSLPNQQPTNIAAQVTSALQRAAAVRSRPFSR